MQQEHPCGVERPPLDIADGQHLLPAVRALLRRATAPLRTR
jgi:hypothetical protein